MAGQDIASIVNVVNLYPIAVDSLRWSLYDEVFLPDAHVDFGGLAVWNDLETLKLASGDPCAVCRHAACDPRTSRQLDGERATCLVTCTVAHPRSGRGRQHVQIDRLV